MNSPGFGELVPTNLIAFNFMYVLIINLISTAIISGLIIDTFSQMRDEQDSIN